MTDTHLTDRSDRERAAIELLDETFDLDRECSRCEIQMELGIVFGNTENSFATGVIVCPHCGYESSHLTADPGGRATEYPERLMVEESMEWVPPWHPGNEDIKSDWACCCGKTWKTHGAATRHALHEHPDDMSMSIRSHDRYPWDEKNLPPKTEIDE